MGADKNVDGHSNNTGELQAIAEALLQRWLKDSGLGHRAKLVAGGKYLVFSLTILPDSEYVNLNLTRISKDQPGAYGASSLCWPRLHLEI